MLDIYCRYTCILSFALCRYNFLEIIYNRIDQFQYIKIQPETIDLNMRLWGINTEYVGFNPQSLVLRSIVLG